MIIQQVRDEDRWRVENKEEEKNKIHRSVHTSLLQITLENVNIVIIDFDCSCLEKICNVVTSGLTEQLPAESRQN